MGSIRYIAIVILAVVLCISITPHSVAAEEFPVISRGESVNISATLLTNGSSGEILANQLVFFFDETTNNLMANTKTDSNGVASLDYSFPLNHPLGNTLVNITFRGNTSLALAPTCQWFTLIITSLTSIDILTQETEFAPYDHLEFSVHLTDDTDNSVDYSNLTILCDSAPIHFAHTNETGYALISIVLDPANFGLGHHTIEVEYEGNLTSYLRGTSSSFEIEIDQISTDIEILNITDSPVMLSQTWSATLQVMSDDGHLTMNPIHILLDESYFGSANIDPDGYARINLIINQSFSIGEHTITLEFQGNERYSSSLVDIVIDVGSTISLNITPSGPAEIGQNITLEISTLDVYSRPLSQGILQIKDTNTNQSIIESLSGQATTTVRFPILGERGPRVLQVEVIDGNLLDNNTIFLNLDIWTRPIIEVYSSNILGFASPLQNLVVDIKLWDYRGLLSEKTVRFYLSNSNEPLSVVTQMDGLARIDVQSPSIEGSYFLHILYEGNQSDYELPSHKEVSFIVSQTIPIEVTLHEYEIIAPLASILVRLQIQALNGTYLEDVSLQYSWIESEGNSPSGTDGIAEIHLPMPSVSGIHTLFYEIDSNEGLQACSGMIYIITTSEDANASQGVGLYGLVLGFTCSLGLSVIPIARRRSLIG